MKIFLMRHGESEFNAKSTTISNSPLSEKGRAQAVSARELVAQLKLKSVYASHLIRAQETAQIAISDIDLTAKVFPDIHEIIMPSFVEDCTDIEEKTRLKHQYYTAFAAGGDCHNGESPQQIIARAQKFLDTLSASPDTYDHALFVSHGFFMRVVAAVILLGPHLAPAMIIHMRRHMRTINTAVSQCVYEHGIWKLLTWNEHTHIRHDLMTYQND